ncbi:NUDIX domain-containing protein [Minwuia thermotolerans]|uniref:DNA mismatch repair protein MutT n=1 Tax=Minwuia thermotolerans TaxID=2056226 RepID=A0A2M9FX75_9PROT|nr:NUDIX hydrolase [Minwuia thermotolerans]PJK28065.1 DNA mismatch repair protein MutT [Minwuia thermotolerans]
MSRQGPALTVDCVVFDAEERLLLIRRGKPPFEGMHALPGGFVDLGERAEEAAARELAEETGIEARPERLIGVYSDPARDPRGHVVSVAFLFRLPPDAPAPRGGGDAAAAAFHADWRELDLAFDHAQILDDALKTPS